MSNLTTEQKSRMKMIMKEAFDVINNQNERTISYNELRSFLKSLSGDLDDI